MPRIPLVIGHRGAPGYRPEHSRSSYERALAAGVDAIEPDVVVTRDGVLVVRHESGLAATTNVSTRAAFTDRLRDGHVDGQHRIDWFTEDFTAEELMGLRCREPWPALRPDSAAFDDTEPVLLLSDVLALARGRAAVVVECKHAADAQRLGWDMAQLLADQVVAAGSPAGLVVESFETGVLDRIRELPAKRVQLIAAEGSPPDAAPGAPSYAEMCTPAGLDALAERVHGISLDTSIVRSADGPALVAAAHERGLDVLCWTARCENVFLDPMHRIEGQRFGDYETEWRQLRDAGVDGVFVDHADLGVAFFRRPSPDAPPDPPGGIGVTPASPTG